MHGGVRRDSGLPLYHQIAGILRGRIWAGEWDDGEKIPSETQLSKQFSVSLVTTRQALELLKNEGILEGRQGSGTFVTYKPHETDHVTLSLPLEAVSFPMAEYAVRVLSRDTVRPPLSVRDKLGVEPGAHVVRVRRVRLGTDGPVSLSTSFIPEELGCQLTEHDLNQPLLMAALEERAGQRITGASQVIEAALADPADAAALEVPLGAAVLLVERAYEFADGSVAYVVVNRHPSGAFRYEARLTREPDRSGDTGSWAAGTKPRWAMEKPERSS